MEFDLLKSFEIDRLILEMYSVLLRDIWLIYKNAWVFMPIMFIVAMTCNAKENLSCSDLMSLKLLFNYFNNFLIKSFSIASDISIVLVGISLMKSYCLQTHDISWQSFLWETIIVTNIMKDSLSSNFDFWWNKWIKRYDYNLLLSLIFFYYVTV